MRIWTILLILTLAGCKGDWGQKYKDFIGAEAYTLSKKYADADLKLKWEDALNTEINSSTIQVEAFWAELDAINYEHVTNLDQLTNEELLTRGKQNAVKLDLLTQLEMEVAELETKNHSFNRLCQRYETFAYFRLPDSTLREVVKTQMPENDLTVYVSNDLIETAIKAIFTLFDQDEQKEQGKLFNEGNVLLQERVIKDQELFNLYKEHCHVAMERNRENSKLVNEAINNLNQAITSRRELFIQQIILIEQQMIPRIVGEVLERFEIRQTLERLEWRRWQAKAYGRIHEIKSTASDLNQTAMSSSDPYEKLKAGEKLFFYSRAQSKLLKVLLEKKLDPRIEIKALELKTNLDTYYNKMAQLYPKLLTSQESK